MPKPFFQSIIISQVKDCAPSLKFIARYSTAEDCITACMHGYEKRSFVYLLTVDFEGRDYCIYVGKTSSQYSRFLSHIKRFEFDKVYLFECDPKYLSESESLVIRDLKPLYNRNENQFALRYSRIFNINYDEPQTSEKIKQHLRAKKEYETAGLFGFSLNPAIYFVLENAAAEHGCNCSEMLQMILEDIYHSEIAAELKNMDEFPQTNLTTTIEYAKDHGRSRESIKQFLREKNRINGAERIGRDWVLVKDAYFPKDRRKKCPR